MKRSYFFSYTILSMFYLLGLGCAETEKEEVPWEDLFDGKTLKGWEQKGGEASYSVRNNTIVGRTAHNTANSFLTTTTLFDDFILELEYKVDSSMNSGIQIRSNSFPQYRNGVVHGYQVEIDPSDRAWSGGIYDESRRGWLHTLANNKVAQKAFKQNEWNHYRIEAFGDTLKTWVNDIPASYLIDDETAKGFIALQVHSIGKDMKEGTEIMWRNIKIITHNVPKYRKESLLTPIDTKHL